MTLGCWSLEAAAEAAAAAAAVPDEQLKPAAAAAAAALEVASDVGFTSSLETAVSGA